MIEGGGIIVFMEKRCDVSFEEIVSSENLCEAWSEFIRGKRKKKDVQAFMLRLGDEVVNLHDDLTGNTYAHGNYAHFRINDPKPREIHKASVRDRLLHHAIHRKLYPFFASTFISDSFSCQMGKGVHRALNRFRQMARKESLNNARTCWILKCDVRKFFASVDHGILIDIFRGRIGDRRLRDLIEHVIKSFEVRPGKGIPLGNLTSQLFANVYMNELDQFVKHDLRMKYYVRYADDFVFLSHDRSELSDCLSRVTAFLSGSLALDLHPEKVFIKTLSSGVDFLGWVHFPRHQVPRTKTTRRILKRVARNPKNETLQSYLGLLNHGNAFKLREKLISIGWLFRIS